MVDHDKFSALDVHILAISSNNSFSQKMFATSLQLSYPLLSDHPDLKIIEHYGVLKRIGEAKQPVAQGAYFLVDKQGIIRGKWIRAPGEVFPNEALLQSAHEINQ